MARPVLLSNGELHVGINLFGEVHDFYYPYVGLENHSAGPSLRHHVGVWVDGRVSWFDSGEWQIDFSYPHGALIGHIRAHNPAIGIIVEFDDTVDAEFSVLIRNIHIINERDEERDIRLFMHQAFAIGDSRSNTDTAQYLPDEKAILHYRGRRAFVISAQDDTGAYFDQYTVGLFGIEGRAGTYLDAEDGELECCNVEHGRVDSTLRLKRLIPGKSSVRFSYWVACGSTMREALYIHKQVVAQGVNRRLDATAKWWREWLKPAISMSEKLDEAHRGKFIESVMLIKSQIDKRGAVIASTDSSMLNYSRDAYAYSWPRDGSYVLWPLIRMGYRDEPYRFFEFCRRGLTAGGYLMHKYRADGALGSSWHPYVHENGDVSAPIQEDETALTLFMFNQFYRHSGDAALLKEFYESMVVPMANFLSGFVDHRTGLPKPSYDLWEERYSTTTYTTAVTYGALLAAADLADEREDEHSAVKWRTAADDIREAASRHLYNQSRGAFNRGVSLDQNGAITYDETIDMSSIFGVFMYGLFPVDGVELETSIKTAVSIFGSTDDKPGLPRYENDGYHRRDSNSLGNYWFVTSLWLAQYYIETNRLDEANKILDWTRDSSSSTGVLPEQVDPETSKWISVAPLNWSQAEYVSTLLDTISGESR
ncbi:MAG: glycoside hydrolase family 15 protein [Candidatus Saccharimonas sp.]